MSSASDPALDTRRAAPVYLALVRWAFARFYREFAWTYDTVAALVSAGYWRDWALSALPALRGRVLELGCGTGNLQVALARRADLPPAIGLDASPTMVALSRAKLAKAGLPARLLRADARALPFPNGRFDTLVATFPSEYIADPATLAEARRTLAPGGRLVVILAAQFTADGLYERAIDIAYRLTLQSSPRGGPASAEPPPELPPDHRLARALAGAGFAVQQRWVPAPGGRVLMLTAQLPAAPTGKHHGTNGR
ncbi:MAG TPA: class I SAM-dependent methyltransferase [Roseiflexaceae bacterium]|nr:class I SAM-dependent methyltransferase [Roseiflexaceae bacterium]